MSKTCSAKSVDQSGAHGDVTAVTSLRAVVEEHFPGLWPAVDLGLSVCATLLLADNSNPVALIYLGGPSSSKTTVADLFADHTLCYVSDNFTPAAFVSHAANRKTKELEKVDLLPRLKHRVLITPELAPIFRGKDDELTQRFSIITRVLDGHGLMTDSGTHGQRGYRGDFLFAWIGCTTPLEPKVWQVMAQLGSRLIFLAMDEQGEVTVEKLLDSLHGPSYGQRLKICKHPLHAFLTALYKAHGGVRGVNWDSSLDPRSVQEWIARMATLLAAARSEPVKESEQGAYTPAKQELPWRAHSVLYNLARGHALVHGRIQLTEDDLVSVAAVVISSMPTACAKVFRALIEREGEQMTVAEVQAVLQVHSREAARHTINDLDRRGLVVFTESGQGKAAELSIHKKWEWCASPSFKALLLGQLVKNRGVCVPPATRNLAQHLSEEEEGEGDGSAHTPLKLTSSAARPPACGVRSADMKPRPNRGPVKRPAGGRR